jgi:signal transduction histidine kinase
MDEALQSLDLHFIPFTQGMLYVGSTDALKNDDVAVVQALADSFAIAYARYDDFVKLEKAKESIELTLSELKATQKQLIQSEKMASLGELTAGIAHEIQNPLNFVNNFSEVSKEMADELREEVNKPELDKELLSQIAEDLAQNQEKIYHHGQRASSIVKGMLEHSRTSSGVKQLTDINALADEYLRLSYHGLRAKDKSFNAEIVTDFDSKLPKVEVVSQDIGRVLLNLINNAFQAVHEKTSMPDALEGERVQMAHEEASSASASGPEGYKPTVTITTELTANSQLLIAIKDNGSGIPDAIKDKIFQPFFTTKETGKGTGLGLSLAYDIVKAHGGELTLESEENKGATFKIILPLSI